jgi:alpha-1,3-rhamnosyltransferase
VSAEQPLVSCLMGAYNHGRYIGRALDTLLAQDLPADRYEVIVVDDGSTDDTRAAVAPYVGERVRYVHKENAGLLDTVNVGVAACRGRYIAFFAGDDETPPDKLRSQAELLERRPEVGLCFGDMAVIDGDGRPIADSFFGAYNLRPQRGRVLGPLLARNFVSGGSMMVRASLRDTFHPLPDWVAWEDWWIALRVAEHAELDYLDQPLSRYRLHGANLAGDAKGDKLVALQRQEIAFRRHMLGGLESPFVSIHELVGALAALSQTIGQVSAATGEPPHDVVAVTASERERALDLQRRSAAARARGDLETAARELVRALAADPTSADAERSLNELLARPLPPRSPAEQVDALLADARSRVTLARAEDVVANPSLLADYSSSVGPDDDATLLIYAPGWAEADAESALLEALAEAGVAEDAMPDMLAAAVEPSEPLERYLAARSAAVLAA